MKKHAQFFFILMAVATFCSACSSVPQETKSGSDVTTSWFEGMLTPPHVTPALPNDYVVASFDPEFKKTKKFNMYSGNIWALPRTARKYEAGADTQMEAARDPFFWVRLSSEVAQNPGTDTFTNEKDIEKTYSSFGLKNVKSAKHKWGDYPVLSVTGERPSGSRFFVAWIGINSNDGWAIMVDYRTPKGNDHPSPEEIAIWERFLKNTK